MYTFFVPSDAVTVTLTVFFPTERFFPDTEYDAPASLVFAVTETDDTEYGTVAVYLYTDGENDGDSVTFAILSDDSSAFDERAPSSFAEYVASP